LWHNSAMVHEALEAANELVPEGWEVEVVDLRFREAARHRHRDGQRRAHGRLLCVGEAWPWGGVTAEVIARVTSEASACSTFRRNGSTPKTRPCRIIPICWTAQPVRPPALSPPPQENCSVCNNESVP